MEQFSSHGSTLRVDLTPEGSDRVLGDDLLELRAHVATREVVYLSVAEVNALIADLEHKESNPDSGGLSPLEESILNELRACAEAPGYTDDLSYTDDLNSQPLAQVR